MRNLFEAGGQVSLGDRDRVFEQGLAEVGAIASLSSTNKKAIALLVLGAIA